MRQSGLGRPIFVETREHERPLHAKPRICPVELCRPAQHRLGLIKFALFEINVAERCERSDVAWGILENFLVLGLRFRFLSCDNVRLAERNSYRSMVGMGSEII